MFDDGHLEFGNCFAFVSVESGNFEFKLDSYEEHIASDEHSPSIGNTSRDLWYGCTESVSVRIDREFLCINIHVYVLICINQYIIRINAYESVPIA